MKLKVLVVFFLINLSYLVLGQQSGSLRIKKYSTYQGLSNSVISSISQDHYGYIWFGTEEGLNRYDGYKFTAFKFDYNDPNSLSDNFISDIQYIKESSQLWVATNNGLNLFDYQKERFIRFNSRSGDSLNLNNNLVSKIARSKSGNLWIGTYGGGISFFNVQKRTFKHIGNIPGGSEAFNSAKVMALLEDVNGKIWVGTQDYGIFIYDPQKNQLEHFDKSNGKSYFPSNAINAIYEDRDHHIWIGTNDGLFFSKNYLKSIVRFVHDPHRAVSISSNIVKTIIQDYLGVYWIGTQSGGVSKFRLNEDMIDSPEKAVFDNIYESENETGLSYNSVYSSFEDKDHNIWIGTFTGGVNFISNSTDPFLKLQQEKNHQTGLSYHKVWGICNDNEGNIWVGTDGGGLNKFTPSTGNIKVFKRSESDPASISDNAILCALKDHFGNLWFGTYSGGLNCYNPKTGKFTRYQNIANDSASLPSNDVRAIYEDSQFNLWIGTNGGGLSLFLPSKQIFKNYNLNKLGVLGNSVRAILQDNKGGYWIGTYGNGLHYISQGFSKVAHYMHKPGDPTSLGSLTIFTIIQDHAGRIWVGTDGGGLSLFNTETGKFINYQQNNGLASNTVRAILEDKSGNLWLSTNNGLSCFSVQKKYFNNFDIQDGIPPGEFSDGSGIFCGDRMYFGNMNGLCYFCPDKVEKEVTQPEVRLVGFQLFNRNVKIKSPEYPESPLSSSIIESKEIVLSYKQSVFTIEFSAINFKTPEKIQYAYIMDGLEKEWNYSGNLRTATYRNLKPGTYTFRVKATNINTLWGDSCTTLQIVIKPPFWETCWAYLLYLAFISGIVFLVYKYYAHDAYLKRNLLYEKITRQKEHELNQEKIRFFTNITHEFRSPLTLILGPLEDLIRERNFSISVGRKLLLIYRNSNRLLDLIDKLLEFRKVETGAMKLKIAKGNIVATLKEICFPFKEIFAEKSISFNLECVDNEIELWYDTEKLFIIFNNLLSNAYKFTHEGGVVTVCISKDMLRSEVNIQVKDTGIGIPDTHLINIFDQYYRIEEEANVKGSGIGLALTKNLIELHKGEITVESLAGIGSCFTVKFLCGNEHFSSDQLNNRDPEYIPNERIQITKEFNQNIQESSNEEISLNEEDSHKIMLIVEDNDEIRSYISDSFKEEYRIIEAINGAIGIELANKHLPDIIVTDIMMPVVDGLELCKKIKTNIKTCHIPVIMLTARNSLQQKQEGYEFGADSYLTKPFSSALLASRISNLLEAKKRLAEHIARNLMFQPDEIHLGFKDEKFISDLIEVINKYIADENFDAEFLAKEMNLSHSALYRKIKALTGYSIAEFVRGIRLKRAAQYLRSKEYMVSEVAYMVGFNDLKHFRQSFKDQYKVSPSDYMKTETYSSGEN
jgi:ligand-binding sensor domain-containing protein/signal transduction histidine kinase/DNA-binding NarL/FixJ family response regulator